jgi:predicted nucleic acid-binding protein
MTWVVDTCLVIDVLEGDPEFGRPSAVLLDKMAGEGLCLCPVSYIELAPAFLGDAHRQNKFLSDIGIQHSTPWEWSDTQRAHKGWDHFVTLRRTRKLGRRPVADILIGAFALGRKGLLTRNTSDFKTIFPSLTTHSPLR